MNRKESVPMNTPPPPTIRALYQLSTSFSTSETSITISNHFLRTFMGFSRAFHSGSGDLSLLLAALS